MNPNSSRTPETSSAEGWVSGGAFLGSILSGTLLGYLADRWLGTDPWLTVIGIVVGSYSGFIRMWQLAKQIENPRVANPKISADRLESQKPLGNAAQIGNDPDVN